MIAAVQGSCAGGGLHFVADADIVIAASDATFFDTHVSLGQAMSYEGVGLSHKMAFEPIMRMALVGRYERMPAARARQLGMVSQVVDPPERLRDEAQALAEKIAKNSPAAMRATKRALWGALETRPHRRLPRRQSAAGRRCGATPTRKKARSRSPRSARRSGWRSHDVVDVRHARSSSATGRWAG